MTLSQASAELYKRGFEFNYSNGHRSYWTRTDGRPEIFLDHSATITYLGNGEYRISDFVNDI